MVGDSSRLRLESTIISPYPIDTLPGHAAWLDWPWKLHRIPDNTGAITWELYNLAADSLEQVNLVDQQPDRVISMKDLLESWQNSVMHSLNGGDY